MIRSMTGYGRGEFNKEGRKYLVEIKSVNHKYSDIYIKIPRQISYLEENARELVKEYISRGKVDVYITFEDLGDKTRSVLLDEALADMYIKSCRNLRDQFDLQDDISVSLIARFPDVLRIERPEEDEEETWRELEETLRQAMNSLVAMRENEGARLRENILEKLSTLTEYVEKVEQRAPHVVKEYKEKLENRIKELVNLQTIDESRLETEVALYADRCSIDEEIIRLKSHLNQMEDTLNQSVPVGKKLDFLVQEMHREINTIGSKANDLEITKSVVEMKTIVDNIREQIQNIE